ncbi:speckle-type POZ protein [Caerostris extrusa]|uniref:Speckle-type POZ protein n=1 Tax=Caerostris extrusa TaxID=172846 RepID=A0AAV4T1F2_CAEEX|nr:speckle-type POZ protein [Caerostris extrusa]
MNGKDTKWKLEIYPRGCDEEDFIETSSAIFKTNDICWGFPELIDREDVIFNRRSEILPQDVLTIRCTMWRNDDEDIEAGQFSALTDIKKSLAGVEGNNIECGQTELLSDQLKEGTTFALQINKLEIMQNENYLMEDSLSLRCEYAFSTGGISEEIESVLNFGADYRKEIIETELKPKVLYNHDDLLDDLKSLYRDETLSDMKLRTDTETFRVHANILSARSEVFKAMFTTEMKETSNRHVYIPDVDNDTLRRMILYLYTDHLEGLEWESASLLYAAADKYAIHSMRKKCSVFLRNAFSFSNACNILKLADSHGDEDLKQDAQDYILANDEDVINTSEWQHFMNTNLKLAADTMYRRYTKGK